MASSEQVSTARRPHSVTGSALRFVLVGGTNTLVTAVALSLLAQVMDPRLAYTLVFAAGVVYSVAMAGRFVFGVQATRRRVAAYTVLYLAVFAVGLLAVEVARRAGMPAHLSGLVVIITAPLTFLGGRLLFVGQGHQRREAE